MNKTYRSLISCLCIALLFAIVSTNARLFDYDNDNGNYLFHDPINWSGDSIYPHTSTDTARININAACSLKVDVTLGGLWITKNDSSGFYAAGRKLWIHSFLTDSSNAKSDWCNVKEIHAAADNVVLTFASTIQEPYGNNNSICTLFVEGKNVVYNSFRSFGLGQWNIANGKSMKIKGGLYTTVVRGINNVPLKMNGNGKIVDSVPNNGIFYITRNSSGQFLDIKTTDTILIGTSSTINFHSGAASIKDTLSNFYPLIAPGVIVSIQVRSGSTAFSNTSFYVHNISVPTLYCDVGGATGISFYISDIKCYRRNAEALRLSSSTSNSGRYWFFGSDTIYGTFSTGGTAGRSINLQSATIYLDSNLILNTLDTLYSGTSTIYFNNQSTAICSLGNPTNQRLYDITHSGSGALTLKTSSGRAFIDGDFSRTGSGALMLACGLQYADDILWDGTGNLTLPSDTLRGTGASGQFHVGSTVGTVSAVNTTLRFDGTTGMMQDDDKGITVKQYIHGANAVVNFHGGAATYYENSTGSVAIFVDGGTLSGTRTQIFHSGTSGLLFEYQGAVPSFNISMQIRASAACSLTIPKITTNGDIFILSKNIGDYTSVFTLLDTLKGYLIYITPQNNYNKMRFYQNGKHIESSNTTFIFGCAYTTGSLIADFTGTTNVKTNVNSTALNNTVIKGTPNFTIGGSLTWQSSHIDSTTNSVYTFNGSGTQTLTSAGKWLPDSIACTGSGTVTLADNLTCGALRVSSGTFNMSGDSVFCARYAGVSTSATLITDASSRLLIGNNGKLYMGGKTWPLTWFAGSGYVYDGGTFSDFRMSGSGDSIKWEPNKKYTFISFNSDNVKGSNGTTGKNYWLAQIVGTRDTIDLPAKDTLKNFWIQGQVFLDTVYCRRSDSCFSGGYNQ